MVPKMKLICNECYVNELTVHDYDGKLYVDPCECQKDHLINNESELESVIQDAVDQGYNIGYNDGYGQIGEDNE